MKKLASLILALLIAVLPTAAYAAGAIDTGRDVSLTLECPELSGLNVRLYHVADVDAYGRLTVREGFEKYNLTLVTGKDDDAWRNIAAALAGSVLKDNVTPDAKGTVTGGSVKFTGIPQGLYLVTAPRHQKDGKYYDMQPFLVTLPSENAETNAWDYAVTAKPKFDQSTIPSVPSSSKISITVTKGWSDEDNRYGIRPVSVTVTLMQGDKAYDTVVLSADNSWKHTWTGLDPSYAYTVAETPVEGYTTLAERNGYEFAVINKFSDTIDPEPSGDDEFPGDDDSTGPTPSGDEDALPQTGQLWWPVPLLLAAGLALICAGLARRRNG